MYNLDGKVALVTGAGCGIGQAIAVRLAQEGCSVAVLDMDEQGARDTVKAVQAGGGTAQAFVADVSDRARLACAVEEILSAMGPIEILINNAGILRLAPMLEMAIDDWKDTFRVNVDGVFNCCQLVAPQMKERQGGRIVNVSSWLGKSGRPYNAAYSASKFAVIGLTQALAHELAPSQVTVNAICPGLVVETGMREYAEKAGPRLQLPSAVERIGTIPVGRLALPEDMARTVAFLVSDEARYMTGQSINVTGGLWMN